MWESLNSLFRQPLVIKWTVTAVIVVIVWLASRIIKRNINRRVPERNDRYRIKKAISIGAYVLILLAAAIIFSDKMRNLTVAIGIAGAGIAFALQEVIASFAGWMAIMFADFYRTGDRVQLGGIKGDVIDIGILRTTIMEMGEWVEGDQYNGRIVRVANSFVFKEPVYNYSGDFPFLWDEIKVPVKYGSDYRLARQILQDIAKEELAGFEAQAREHWKIMVNKYMIENAQIEPLVMLVANDNWVEFTLRYVVDYKRRRITKDRLFTLLLDRIGTTKGKVAMASATLHLVDLPAVKTSSR
jgi:small-conductance mechanosensitive channel